MVKCERCGIEVACGKHTIKMVKGDEGELVYFCNDEAYCGLGCIVHMCPNTFAELIEQIEAVASPHRPKGRRIRSHLKESQEPRRERQPFSSSEKGGLGDV